MWLNQWIHESLCPNNKCNIICRLSMNKWGKLHCERFPSWKFLAATMDNTNWNRLTYSLTSGLIECYVGRFSRSLLSFCWQVRVTEGRTTCVRCRVYDRRVNRIHVTRDNEIVRRSDSVQLDEHLNVADGGLSELTLTFLNPVVPTNKGSTNITGHYRCSTPGSAVEFHIQVLRASSRST